MVAAVADEEYRESRRREVGPGYTSERRVRSVREKREQRKEGEDERETLLTRECCCTRARSSSLREVEGESFEEVRGEEKGSDLAGQGCSLEKEEGESG